MKAPNKTHDDQHHYHHSNQRNPDNIRQDTQKHRYQGHDDMLTNDENFKEGRQKRDTEMDFRDKNENLEA